MRGTPPCPRQGTAAPCPPPARVAREKGGMGLALLNPVGELNKVLHGLRVAHCAGADGFFQWGAHQQFLYRDLHLFAAECARNLWNRENLVGNVVRRDVFAQLLLDPRLERVIQLDAISQDDEERYIVAPTGQLDADNQTI